MGQSACIYISWTGVITAHNCYIILKNKLIPVTKRVIFHEKIILGAKKPQAGIESNLSQGKDTFHIFQQGQFG